MPALIAKDSPWLFVFLLAGAIPFTAVASQYGFEDLFVFPTDRYSMHAYYAWWPIALGFGLFAAGYDEFLGTEDYLRHRPVSPARLFLARITGCGLVLAAWIFLPPVFVALTGATEFPGDFAGIGIDKLGYPTVVLSVFALGLFAGTLPHSWWLRLGLAAGLGLVWIDLADPRVATRAIGSGAAYAGIHIAAAAVLLAAAYQNVRTRRDPDCPLPLTGLAPLGVCLLAAALAMGWGLGEWFRSAERALAFPRIVQDRDGTYRSMVTSWDATGSHHRFVDGDGVDAGPAEDYAQLRFAEKARPSREGPPRFRVQLRELRHQRRAGRAYLHAVPGLVSLYLRPRIRGETGRVVMLGRGEGPDQQKFSHRAILWHEGTGSPLLFVGDPTQGELWSCDLRRKQLGFRAIPLPDEDRFVRFAHDFEVRESIELRRRIEAVFAELDPDPGEPARSSEPVWIQGRDHSYALAPTNLALAPLTGELARALPAAGVGTTDHEGPRIHRSNSSVLSPEFQVRGEDGGVLFTARYRLRRPLQYVTAAVLVSDSLLRPPAFRLLDIPRALDPHRGRDLDAPWAWGLHALLVLVLAGFAYRRLGRMGATPGRRWFWSLAILVLGVVAAVFYRLVESDRAWRRLPPEPTTTPSPPLIQTVRRPT